MELPVRLSHTHLAVAVLNGVDVVDGVADRRHLALNIMLGRAAVHQSAKRLADEVMNARLTACTNRHERLCLRRSNNSANRKR